MYIRLFFTLLISLILPLNTQAQALQSLGHKTLSLQAPGYTQLTFFDIWGNYGASGPDELWVNLPTEYRAQIHQHIFIQPEFNVTEAQLRQYQSAYPQAAPLVFDHRQTLLRQFHLWQLPAQVLLHQGKVIFAGSHRDFVQFIQQKMLAPSVNTHLTTAKE